MTCGRPLGVGTGTASVSPLSVSTRSVSISALITKALPVCRWQSRQWQQWTNIGFDASRKRIRPQAQPPSRAIFFVSIPRSPPPPCFAGPPNTPSSPCEADAKRGRGTARRAVEGGARSRLCMSIAARCWTWESVGRKSRRGRAMPGRSAKLREAYAASITRRAGVVDPRVEAAFAVVPREDFSGPPPWHVSGGGFGSASEKDLARLYDDVLVAIDAGRGINNGQPSLHAMSIEALAIKEGETVVQIGAGAGYYTAILAISSARPAG